MCTPIADHAPLSTELKTTVSLREQGFEPIKQLGEGDPTVVFLVKNNLGELFAAKRFRAKDEWCEGMPEDFLERIYDASCHCLMADEEIKIGKRFEGCPHVVQTLTHFLAEEEGKIRTYILLEYVDGVSLSFYEDMRSVSSFKKHVMQLLEALKAGFEKGLIHEDLHSGNMMIDTHGDLKLIDVGSFTDIDEDDPHGHYFATHLETFITMFLTHNVEDNNEFKELIVDIEKTFKTFNEQEKEITDLKTHFIPLIDELLSLVKPSPLEMIKKV